MTRITLLIVTLVLSVQHVTGMNHHGRLKVAEKDGPQSKPPNVAYRALTIRDFNQVQRGESILSSKRYGDAPTAALEDCPAGGVQCPICHVGLSEREKGTDFISLSRRPQDAEEYNKRGIIKVDLNMIDPSLIFDLTVHDVRNQVLANKATGNHRHEELSEDARQFSCWDGEVIVKGEIPFSAYELL